MSSSIRTLLLFFVSVTMEFWCVAGVCDQSTPIYINADLTDVIRKLYHAEIDIPAKPGPLTLTMAEWIPGDHAANGCVKDLTGLTFSVNGVLLPWRRDDIDLYAFHLTIPAGASSVHVHVDTTVLNGATDSLAILEWERLMFYPAGVPVRDIQIQPSVRVPSAWGVGTSLRPITAYDVQHPQGGLTKYATVTVEELEDSPVITGRYFHEYDLLPDVTPRHFLDVVGDKPNDVVLNAEFLHSASRLIREAWAAYGPPHYNSYHFLLTFSSVAGSQGREHAESSDNGVPENAYTSASTRQIFGELLPHEFTHSWNGKYRRPSGLYQPDFATPQQGALLWVYEGLTNYLGRVLSVRSGFVTKEWFLEHLASIAADMEYTPGRKWRSTEDTAIASSIDEVRPGSWANLQRGQDYYPEGDLFWLDVDTLIRQRTDGQKSLTDFLHIFLGKGGKTGPITLTYTRQDLIENLNRVLPYDWSAFIYERIDLPRQNANIDGIERGGYRLTYQEEGTEEEHQFGADSFWFSLGLRINRNGQIREVRSDSPADKEQIVADDKIVAVDGMKFSDGVLTSAIDRTTQGTQLIDFIIERGNVVFDCKLNYRSGNIHPVLKAIPGAEDYLDEILTPLAALESR